jgi:hypothetical protein
MEGINSKVYKGTVQVNMLRIIKYKHFFLTIWNLKVKVDFNPVLPWFPKEFCFWESSQASSIFRYDRSDIQTKISTEHWWYVLTKETRYARRKICPSSTLSSTNLTWTGLGLNRKLHVDRPITNRLSQSRLLQSEIILNYTGWFRGKGQYFWGDITGHCEKESSYEHVSNSVPLPR